MTPDTINAIFESTASMFILLSIVRLDRDKKVRGLSVVHVAFFWLWGVWNVYYYPHMGQVLSGLGAIAVLIANTVWTGQLIYYTWAETKGKL